MQIIETKTVYSESVLRETGAYKVAYEMERIIDVDEVPSTFWENEFIEYSYLIV